MTDTVSPPTANPLSTRPRRILSVWLSRLAIDRWRLGERLAPGEGADADPLALIAETAHGPRIEALNDAGLAAGPRPGMMLADARAVCPRLKVAPSDPTGDMAFLGKLGAWVHRWGPWSALDAPDGLLVDVTAVAHLFGGEARLLADARYRFAARGLTVRLAIASTAGAAWALAHFGPDGCMLPPGDAKGIAAGLNDLPVAALRLEDDVLTVLRRLGLKRIGDLTARFQEANGRDALHRRFRRKTPSSNPLIRLDQLLGKLPEPLLPVVPVTMPLVQRRLMEPIRHRELLDIVIADLASELAGELEKLGQGARRLELGLWRVDGDVAIRELELAAATREAAHIARLFAAKLDDVDAGFGIECVRLRASWSEALALPQRDIETKVEVQGTSLATCIDRLTVRLGPDAVRKPVCHASHIPERAQRWQPPLEPEPASQGQLAFHSRPLKMLDRAEKIAVLYDTPAGYPQRFRWRGEVHEVVRIEGPERIAPEWWREKGNARLRDYYRIEDHAGRRYWIYRLGFFGDGRGGPPDWFLQGLCA
ncbi:DUF6504 family protein [Tsuneonella sp. HG249]